MQNLKKISFKPSSHTCIMLRNQTRELKTQHFCLRAKTSKKIFFFFCFFFLDYRHFLLNISCLSSPKFRGHGQLGLCFSLSLHLIYFIFGALTNCILVDSFTVIPWTSPFVILGFYFYRFYSILMENSVSKQCKPLSSAT